MSILRGNSTTTAKSSSVVVEVVEGKLDGAFLRSAGLVVVVVAVVGDVFGRGQLE
jgi:hypothetical protein